VPGDEHFAAWFRLLETPGVGRDTARRLLAACGSPQAVLAAPAPTLRALASPAVAGALQQDPPDFAKRLQAAQAWLAGGEQRHVLAVGDTGHPPLLLQTADPPLLLYVQGQLDALSARSIAVVGSRRPSAQGLDNARSFARALGAQGYAVVSGLAQGIDAAAHEGALAAGALTVAVMGTGPDRIYPARHRELAQRIAAQGALLTEYAPGVAALPEHFPQRNRLIAGLTRGTLVVEAALRSGSLITARLATEAGREVFAIPGSIHALQSQGCHALIKQGAQLVETPQDIFDTLDMTQLPRQAALALDTPPPDPLLDALGQDPVTLDALLARTGWPVSELTARLLELELDGHVARLPGGLFQQRHTG
jgi:DNA processing protein